MNVEIKISEELIPFKEAIERLENRVKNIKSGNANDFLWILEHPKTYTAGLRSNNKEILDKSIKITNTNRGGKITLHNPGQKIVYFAIDLNKRKRDIRNLVRNIENSIIEFLHRYNIESKADNQNIGVWVKGKKIAAIGFRVTKWIAYHGCSINIQNNLKDYKKIIPFGLDNSKITSMKNEGIIKFEEINSDLVEIFRNNLTKL